MFDVERDQSTALSLNSGSNYMSVIYVCIAQVIDKVLEVMDKCVGKRLVHECHLALLLSLAAGKRSGQRSLCFILNLRTPLGHEEVVLRETEQ